MIRRLLRKDWRLLWPMVVLVTAVQIGLQWAVFSAGLFGENVAAVELLGPLGLTWFAGIAALAAAAVHQDPIPGVDQDWLIRPIRRRDLLLEKLAFIALTVSVPMFVLDVAHALAVGFPPAQSLSAMIYKELYVLVCFLIPVVALASATRNMAELAILGAALVVTYALSLAASAYVLGPQRCPTCDTGLLWLQHLLQHVEIFAGAVIVLGLQYYRRRTEVSRILAVLGAVVLIFVQLPWNPAFHLQQRLSGVADDTPAVTLQLASRSSAADGAAKSEVGSAGAMGSRVAARALLHGDVDQAIGYLRRSRRDAAPVSLSLPLTVGGLAPDDVLLVDRLDTRLLGLEGRVLYQGVAGTSEDMRVLRSTLQSFAIPAKMYQREADRPVQFRGDYSLTLMRVSAQYRVAALGGTLRSADLGVCSTGADKNAVGIRCKQLGRAPFCISATLVGPEGRRNPEVLRCNPDYRRFLRSFDNPLGFVTIGTPIRDPYGLVNYPVSGEDLAQAYLLVKVYSERAHFKRSVQGATPRLSDWQTAR